MRKKTLYVWGAFWESTSGLESMLDEVLTSTCPPRKNGNPRKNARTSYACTDLFKMHAQFSPERGKVYKITIEETE